MATSDNGGVDYPAGVGAAVDVKGDFLRLATSIKAKIVRSFPLKSDRASAFPSPQEGAPAYVQGSGLSLYDGNSRSGTTGWSWVGGRILSWPADGVGATSSATPNNIVATGNIVLPSKRLLLVSTWCQVYANMGGVLARVFLGAAGVTVPATDQQVLIDPASWSGGTTGPAWRQYASQTFVTTAGPGTISFTYQVLRVDGSATNSVYATGSMQVVDLGPHD